MNRTLIPVPGRAAGQDRRPAWSGMIPQPAPGYTTRDESLDLPAIEEALVPGAVVVLVPATAGAAGWTAASGRSQLAAHLARSAGGVDLVAWVSAGSRASVLAGYAEAAAALGLSLAGGTEAAASRFAAWLRTTPRPWLLVLDDMENSADLDGLWPAGPSGRLLVTARDPGLAAGRAQVMPVGAFTPREAVAYLRDLLTTDPDHRSGQLDLALALDCEPAALAHAGAVIAASWTSCRDYLEGFEHWRVEAAPDGASPVLAAELTWRISSRHAERRQPGAWPMLVLAAHLDGHAIPLAVLTGAAARNFLEAGTGDSDKQLPWKAVRTLGTAGLLEISTGEPLPIARMSPALRAAVLDAAKPELAALAALAAAHALQAAWPAAEPDTVTGAALRGCAAALLDAAGDTLWAGGGCHRVLHAAGQSLEAAGMAGPAAAWWQRVAGRSAVLLGEGHDDTFTADMHLAGALLAAGRAAAAVPLATRVLAAQTATYGPGHDLAVAAAALLGRALTSAGRAPDAIAVLEAAARGGTPGSEATLAAVEEHAAACLAAGQAGHAVRLLRQALDGRERTRGRDDPAALETRQRLAGALLAAGRPRDAVAQCKRLVSGSERAYGPGRPGTLAACVSLAGALTAAGQLGPALRQYRYAAAGYEQALGAGHPDTLACHGQLARASFELGRAGEAVALLSTAIETAKRLQSPGDPVAVALRGQLEAMTREMQAQ